ncbi:MAG: hypothetical protein AB1921_07425 [Thermodesulfobacteriota bacterium]
MAVRKVGQDADDGIAILRVSIPKTLLDDIRETKRICRDFGLVFDIRPDVTDALEKAVSEARQAIARERARAAEHRGR